MTLEWARNIPMNDSVQLVSNPSDHDCLEAWRREPGAESLRPVIERYLGFVYSAAHRRGIIYLSHAVKVLKYTPQLLTSEAGSEAANDDHRRNYLQWAIRESHR